MTHKIYCILVIELIYDIDALAVNYGISNTNVLEIP